MKDEDRFKVECASLFKHYRKALCLALEQERESTFATARKLREHSSGLVRIWGDGLARRASEIETLKNWIFFGAENVSELVSLYGDTMLTAAVWGEAEALAAMNDAHEESEVSRYAARAADMNEIKVRLTNIRDRYFPVNSCSCSR
ncbi:hypothetical protein OG599_09115 [Streptomyces sp. NBC_01335]|uniref:hypothetical protein n=1 Tax=Streptomyces sp. NBC_01335 TaxID=2903828 RepID=UPI002E0DA87F|nr:hypothetical protein OG599_09115 [Streptomyces sp. NBC_01335]